jgi:hypothetical protein
MKTVRSIAKRDIFSILFSLSQATNKEIEDALKWITWAPYSPKDRLTHLNLASIPFIDLGNEQLGTIFIPDMLHYPITETRRTLASINKVSEEVGHSYETYIRSLFIRAGCEVVDHPVKVEEGGKIITDVDVLAFKDGVTFIVQAKHIIEPNSHHSVWKAQQEIYKGVKQCLAVRSFFQREPEKLASHFKSYNMIEPLETLCLVISPVLAFGSELYWPVTVVDDAYLEYIINVGETRYVRIDTGEIMASVKLFHGERPSGQELKALLLKPEFLKYCRGEDPILEEVKNVIEAAEFRRFLISDSLS